MLLILAIGALMYNLMRGWMYDFGIGMVILAKMALADVCDMDSLYQVIGNGADESDDDRRRLVELLQSEGLLKKCGR